jgi:hypothetical protein
MTQPNNHDGRPDPRAPQGLIDDLRALYGAEVPVPADVDRQVARLARRRLAGGRARTMTIWRLAPLAAAAAVLLALGAWTLLRAPHAAPPALAAREDVDGNGRVDILDAFLVARRIESGQPPPKAWDVNGDGVVDQADVDAIARAAVALKKGVL